MGVVLQTFQMFIHFFQQLKISYHVLHLQDNLTCVCETDKGTINVTSIANNDDTSR